MQDSTSRRSLFYYLGVLLLARLFGWKVFVLSQGIGPLNRRFSRFLTRVVLTLINGVSCRDEFSVQLLKELGLSKRKLNLSADLAYFNQPITVKDTKVQLKSGFNTSRVALSLRDLK